MYICGPDPALPLLIHFSFEDVPVDVSCLFVGATLMKTYHVIDQLPPPTWPFGDSNVMTFVEASTMMNHCLQTIMSLRVGFGEFSKVQLYRVGDGILQ